MSSIFHPITRFTYRLWTTITIHECRRSWTF